MKFVHPEINKVFDTERGKIHCIVIENPSLFRRLLADLYAQQEGLDGDSVISIDNMPVTPSKYMEVLDRFASFELNRKPLLSKMAAALEKQAASSEYWERTGKLLLDISDYLNELAFEYPCDIIFPKLGVAGIIKAATPELRSQGSTVCEKVLDYMELVRTFDREKLFLTVNMRAFVEAEEVGLFMQTVLSHGYHVIMLENCDYAREKWEERLIIDRDLCEID